MQSITLIGENKLASFLKEYLASIGYEVFTGINTKSKNIEAIIDLSNADTNESHTSLFLHNTAQIGEILKYSKITGAPLIFVYRENPLDEYQSETGLFTALDSIKEFSQEYQSNYALVQVEDILGEDINTSSRLSEFIESVINDEPLVVTNDINEHYFLDQRDFAGAIIQIAKEVRLSHKPKSYTLLPWEPITEIELAHFIKALTDLKLEIEYSEDEPAGLSEINTISVYPQNWKPQVSLEHSITSIFHAYDIPVPIDALDEIEAERHRMQEELKEEVENGAEKRKPAEQMMDAEIPKSTKVRNPIAKKKKKAVIGTLTAALILTLSLPSVIFAYNFKQGMINLATAADALKNLEPETSYQMAQNSLTYLNRLENDTPFLLETWNKANGLKDTEYRLLINTAGQTAEAVKDISYLNTETLLSFRNTQPSVLGVRTPRQVGGTFLPVRTPRQTGEAFLPPAVSTDYSPQLIIGKSQKAAGIVENNLKSLISAGSKNSEQLKEILSLLEQNHAILEKLDNIQPALKEISGMNKTQKYLVLFQDPTQPRSSGGVPISIGIFEVSNGKITKAKFETVGEINSQLELNENTISPPQPLVQAFARDQMLFQDATWNVSFTETARKSTSLYKLVRQDDINGVIAVNLEFIKSLLKVSGPVQVSSFGETVTNENLEAKIKKYSLEDSAGGNISAEGEFFTDFIKVLANKVLSSPSNLSGRDILEALERKELIAFHFEDAVNTSLLKNNWGGGVSKSPDDYLYVIDSNLGKPISTADIRRSLDYSGTYTLSGEYTRRLKITYENIMQQEAGEDYLNYLQIMVPDNALLNSATLTSETGSRNIIKSVRVLPSGDKTIYEIDLLVKAGEIAIVELEYSTPDISFADRNIDLYVQKQPGIQINQLNVSFGEDIMINTTLEKDKIFKFDL